MTTTDLTKFGSRKKKKAEELLRAWREQGLPDLKEIKWGYYETN